MIKRDVKNIVQNKPLLMMMQMRQNAEAHALGLNIGNFDEEFEESFINGRELDMFLLGIPMIGFGYATQWIVDITKIPCQLNIEDPIEDEADYIQPFCAYLNHCVIDEVIHATIGLTHEDYSRKDFVAIMQSNDDKDKKRVIETCEMKRNERTQ